MTTAPRPGAGFEPERRLTRPQRDTPRNAEQRSAPRSPTLEQRLATPREGDFTERLLSGSIPHVVAVSLVASLALFGLALGVATVLRAPPSHPPTALIH